MTKRMLIDASHVEETRVAITDGNRLTEYDYESQSRKPLKGSIFLAKVTRVEPSLQAAFVNFGGNRHGFLPFSEIHPDYFRIPVSDREALMAEQEELLKQHDEEEEAFDEDGASDDEDHDVQDADDVEEDHEPEVVGGNIPAIEDDAEEAKAEPADAEQEEKPKKGRGRAAKKASTKEKKATDDEIEAETEAEAEEAEDEASDENVSDDADANGDDEAKDVSSEDGADGAEGDEEGDDAKNKNRRRRGYRGRGRGRGRHGQNRNKNVEVVGGEEIDDEQRFRFNLRRKYKIQEVIKRGQIMLVQVNKEERGNKGAAVGTYLSLPGRYCVLMPNSPRAGGVSRKIANHKDRARMRDIVKSLEVPKGMSVIVRTAGVARTKAEIKRDLDYLMRLWDSIRELTLESTAPATVYEEADLIKRAVRDHYTRDVEEILVAGEEGHKIARDFMKMMIPSHVKKVVKYEDNQLPLFHRYQIENQIDEIGQVEVRLRSGGYLVINPTEALVSIDVNSGKATKGRHIEETALKTNLEAADEVARQLRLRDLGGLVVIDFIDMEDRRNNGKVERRMKEALSTDRARVQVGRISSFGLMELSRQRLSPSLTEAQFEKCCNCSGSGVVRTADAMSIIVLRAIEEEGIRARAAQIIVHVTAEVALYMLNYKRKKLGDIEERYGFEILIRVDESLPASECRVEVSVPLDRSKKQDDDAQDAPAEKAPAEASQPASEEDKDESAGNKKSRRRGRRGGRNRNKRNADGDAQNEDANVKDADASDASEGDKSEKQEKPSKDKQDAVADESAKDEKAEEKPKRRRRSTKKADDKAKSDASEDKSAASANDDVKPDGAPKKQASKSAKDADKADAPKEVKGEKQAEKAEEKPKGVAKADKPKAAPKKKPAAKKADNDSAKEHEVVNQMPNEKKKGWWNRLVE